MVKTIIGIDLGTTNTLAAFSDGGQLRLIPNDRGHFTTPSIVAWSAQNGFLTGEAAKNQAVINPDGTVLSVKRSMGTDKTFPLGGQALTAPEVCARILAAVKRDAEQFLGSEVTEAVITVPAYFSERQRAATTEAARLAGLKVRRLVNEPTAAALAFAHQTAGAETLLVYDLGGGTFDVTILEKQGQAYRVKVSRGDGQLGGLDFDQLIFGSALAAFEAQTGEPITDPVILQQLRDQAERAKIDLSTHPAAQLSLPFFGADRRIVHLSHVVQRRDFERLIEPLAERTLSLVEAALEAAGLKAADITKLVLSGGSTRIPLLRQRLKARFGWEPEGRVNPEEIVAQGAALQAVLLESNPQGITLADLTPFALGLEIDDGSFHEILPRDQAIPASVSQKFTTVADGQTAVEIKILQSDGSDRHALGRFLLAGLEPAPAGEARVAVSFALDEDGLLQVTAVDQASNNRQELVVTSLPSASVAAETPADRLQSWLKRVENLPMMKPGAPPGPDAREWQDWLALSRKALAGGKPEAIQDCLGAAEVLWGELKLARSQ